ncbi:MAG: hypothetical protein HY222_04155 [Thaumarchaeota archaeon]|nr:hypothetical protein [Nitrososphaerota archaeon]MBI3641569.1 hypothetical protein [Nitrososphaerota archaeon]
MNSIQLFPDVFLAFLISFIVIVAIILSVNFILGRMTPKAKFTDILRASDRYPSLSIFQFFLWTIVVAFAFLGIYFIRIFGGVLDPTSDIPNNLLILMGISTAVPITSHGIVRIKNRGKQNKPLPANNPSFANILHDESDKPTLTKFQMFAWTWISILIYFVILFSKVTDPANLIDVQYLNLPDVDFILVVLMGLSQGAYLGGKSLAKSP